MTILRPESVTIGERTLPLPIYFPSISSVKTVLQLHEYLYLLSALAGLNNQFLLSAFDLADIKNSQHVKDIMSSVRKAGVVTLMDSGNYESFWKNAQMDWTQEKFHNMLGAFPCDLAFGFDEQNPPVSVDEHVALIIERWHADQLAAKTCKIIPIIHAQASDLPTLCSTVATKTGVTMLAVPERRLGAGVLERARAVQAIRLELNNIGHYTVLHLLGTGNPTSIALYSAMGADSFDGLEWCQMVVDYETGLLHHFSQADFFAEQTAWNEHGLSFQARTLAHNLEFFSDWMRRLRDAIRQNQLSEFCRFNLPNRAFQHCASIAGWN